LCKQKGLPGQHKKFALFQGEQQARWPLAAGRWPLAAGRWPLAAEPAAPRGAPLAGGPAR